MKTQIYSVKNRLIQLLLFLIFLTLNLNLKGQEKIIHIERYGAVLSWDLSSDEAVLTNSDNKKIWNGSLLPSIWYTFDSVNFFYSKAKVDVSKCAFSEEGANIFVSFSGLGNGNIYISLQPTGLVIDSLKVQWANTIPLIHSLYFGTDLLTSKERQVVQSLEYPFWPDWTAQGYCIPTAKGAPIQSFFKSHQFGHATIPLGSFGQSLGTPYAAAFPRPLYSAAMGGSNGWIAFGSGDISEGAMTLRIKATTACIEYLYREDLWGGKNELQRSWNRPLIISWSLISAWDAYYNLFDFFPETSPTYQKHQLSHWNTWGDFRKRNFDMKAIAEAAVSFEAEELTWDMSWETFASSGIPNLNRFPDFYNDIDYLKSKGLEVGFWQSVLWIDDYLSMGLTKEDIILGKDGKPRLVGCMMSPFKCTRWHYALDPSSENTRKFLKEKTKRIVQKYQADLLKLDFGYGIPSPDIGVPRNPKMRGEKYAFTLLEIITQAAKEIKPDITFQYYGIHPLMKKVQNLLALDDMADAGNFEKEGHGQWSIWASLAGIRGMAIMASSGYDWDNDSEILLNTTIIGTPGLLLPTKYKGGEVPAVMRSRRIALGRWYRKTTGWKPLWLNTHKGSLRQEPTPYCWGRLETFNGKEMLTALALREDNKQTLDAAKLNNLEFEGNWAVIAQDNNSIFKSNKLALVPFSDGFIKIPRNHEPKEVKIIYKDKSEVKDYKWCNGFLTIIVQDDEMKNALVGYEIIQ